MAAKKHDPSQKINAVSLNFEDYRAYGDVISVRNDIPPSSANMGTAQRYDRIAEFKNLRPQLTQPNLCFFQCTPQLVAPKTHFEIHLLEKHPLSTQAFIPMNGAKRYLVVVCLGNDEPDLSTLRAFLATDHQGITYRPGVWHHPLIAMDQNTGFACMVWEDGSPDDCKVFKLNTGVRVDLPHP
jgi:ureidoglycolate lyase